MAVYPDDSAANNEAYDKVAQSLTNHTPTPGTLGLIEGVRSLAKDLAHVITHSVKDRRERSLAITKLEETVMWAVKGLVLDDLDWFGPPDSVGPAVEGFAMQGPDVNMVSETPNPDPYLEMRSIELQLEAETHDAILRAQAWAMVDEKDLSKHKTGAAEVFDFLKGRS